MTIQKVRFGSDAFNESCDLDVAYIVESNKNPSEVIKEILSSSKDEDVHIILNGQVIYPQNAIEVPNLVKAAISLTTEKKLKYDVEKIQNEEIFKVLASAITIYFELLEYVLWEDRFWAKALFKILQFVAVRRYGVRKEVFYKSGLLKLNKELFKSEFRIEDFLQNYEKCEKIVRKLLDSSLTDEIVKLIPSDRRIVVPREVKIDGRRVVCTCGDGEIVDEHKVNSMEDVQRLLNEGFSSDIDISSIDSEGEFEVRYYDLNRNLFKKIEFKKVSGVIYDIEQTVWTI